MLYGNKGDTMNADEQLIKDLDVKPGDVLYADMVISKKRVKDAMIKIKDKLVEEGYKGALLEIDKQWRELGVD